MIPKFIRFYDIKFLRKEIERVEKNNTGRSLYPHELYVVEARSRILGIEIKLLQNMMMGLSLTVVLCFSLIYYIFTLSTICSGLIILTIALILFVLQGRNSLEMKKNELIRNLHDQSYG